jgi:hypothetical protein
VDAATFPGAFALWQEASGAPVGCGAVRVEDAGRRLVCVPENALSETEYGYSLGVELRDPAGRSLAWPVFGTFQTGVAP